METNIIFLPKLEEMSYPVGFNMNLAMHFIKSATLHFIESFAETTYTGIEIFCRGSSGAILSALFVAELSKYKKYKLPLHTGNFNHIIINHVKKENESSHSNVQYGIVNITNAVVVVDDFISSGNTLRSIYNKIKDYNKDNAVIDYLIAEHVTKEERLSLNFEPLHIITT